jgi:hypothetical protein
MCLIWVVLTHRYGLQTLLSWHMGGKKEVLTPFASFFASWVHAPAYLFYTAKAVKVCSLSQICVFLTRVHEVYFCICCHYSVINTPYVEIVPVTKLSADPSGRAVCGVGLRPHSFCDRGFESCSNHGCCLLFLCCVVLYRYRPLRRADHSSRVVLRCA